MIDLFNYTPPAGSDEAHARNSDPDTSHEAAEAISPKRRALQMRVLRFAANQLGGWTDRALEAHFGDSGSTFRTRRAELTEGGYIRDTGKRMTYGENGKGRRHIVWMITESGLRMALSDDDP